MAGYQVVPQYVVDVLAKALSQDPNQGAIIAESVCRSEAGEVIQMMAAGVELAPIDRARLPGLLPGHTWKEVSEQIGAAAKSHIDW